LDRIIAEASKPENQLRRIGLNAYFISVETEDKCYREVRKKKQQGLLGDAHKFASSFPEHDKAKLLGDLGESDVNDKGKMQQLARMLVPEWFDESSANESQQQEETTRSPQERRQEGAAQG
jgi:hypothetical protein